MEKKKFHFQENLLKKKKRRVLTCPEDDAGILPVNDTDFSSS